MEARKENVSRKDKLNKIRSRKGPWSIGAVLVDGSESQIRREWMERKESEYIKLLRSSAVKTEEGDGGNWREKSSQGKVVSS